MSRTRKGAKGPGYEVDRKREGKRGWQSPGRGAKDAAHAAERAAGRRVASEDLYDGQARSPGGSGRDGGREGR